MIWERKQQVGSSSRIHWNVCCLLSNWILRGVEIYISAQKEKFHFRLLSAYKWRSKESLLLFSKLTNAFKYFYITFFFLSIDGVNGNDNIEVAFTDGYDYEDDCYLHPQITELSDAEYPSSLGSSIVTSL